jgi:hypothetical protein
MANSRIHANIINLNTDIRVLWQILVFILTVIAYVLIRQHNTQHNTTHNTTQHNTLSLATHFNILYHFVCTVYVEVNILTCIL